MESTGGATAASNRERGTYGALGQFLSPWPKAGDRIAMLRAVPKDESAWGAILRQANHQFCTPLLFATLQQHELLAEVPDDVRDYLQLLYDANGERNAEFVGALRDILDEFAARGCESILLKGAATFFDDLYGGPGARMMGDLDILIPPGASGEARAVLRRLGYRFDRAHREGRAGPFADNDHHHLPRAWLPGTPVVIELHTRIARRQGGRALPEQVAWRDLQPLVRDGVRAQLLSPTNRLLHNAVHALVPHCEFIRADVSLANVVEFAYLARRYAAEVDWDEWLAHGRRAQLSTELLSYAALASELTGMPYPFAHTPPLWARLHARRISATATGAAMDGLPPPARGRLGRALTRHAVAGYYRLRRPAWLWHNYFYQRGLRHLPVRIGYLLRHFLGAPARPRGETAAGDATEH
jgi:hypothetical protein